MRTAGERARTETKGASKREKKEEGKREVWEEEKVNGG